MKLSAIIKILESQAPLKYQEGYDNSGLSVGERGTEITGVLLCLDVTPEIIDEAAERGLNLVISHHPVIFSPLKQITDTTSAGKIILRAIKKGIAVYSMHTNLDNIIDGVNQKICEKLQLKDTRILVPARDCLKKLVTFVPSDYADKVRNALFEAGAGHIGNYDSCSYNTEGQGTFKGLEGATPFAGDPGKLHFEKEVRIETIFPSELMNGLLAALRESHPYEEVAFDIYPLDNTYSFAGSGMIGRLERGMKDLDFLTRVKDVFKCKILRHSILTNNTIEKVAVCGGSGAFLIPAARNAGADLFITGEIKYHEFFEAGDKMIVADIGHYESEQYTVEIFYDILIKNLPNFAIHFSRIQSSPVNYL